jgi:glucosamine--fructose-6-phosphate aminotransferase (isomerizing)
MGPFRGCGAAAIAFVNDVTSPLARGADTLLSLHAGLIASLTAGTSLVARWSDDNELPAALSKFPSVLDSSSASPPATEAIETLAQASSLFVVGRGATHAVAAEAALKLKETSAAIHAEAFSSAELLHGPAGIIGP